ncbi:MAG: hypothetical protein IJ668_08795, partial [Selenomonadaceae bacterium]|nr:hypothetical protein [Selenomonadaceae bacterium]
SIDDTTSEEDTTSADDTTSEEDTTSADDTTSEEDTTSADDTTSEEEDTTSSDDTTSEEEDTTSADDTTSTEDTTSAVDDTTSAEDTTTGIPSADDATEDTRSWNTVEVSGDSTTDDNGITTTNIDTSDISDGDQVNLAATDNNDTTNLDLSNVDGAVKVTLPDTGTFNITMPSNGGSRVEIPEEFTGTVNLTTSDGGDIVIAKSSNGEVNITGGSGDDTFVVEGANVDLSGGGKDIIYGYGTFNGYDPDTGTEFRVETNNIYDALTNGNFTFGNGALNLGGDTNNAIVLDQNAGNNGNMTINLTDANGNSVRVTGSYSSGGTLDGSGSSTPVLYVGNNDGSKEGTTGITTGSGNDTAIAGDGDVIANTGGTDQVILNNSDNGGATLDQTQNPSQRATNNISGYDALKNLIRQTAEMFGQMTARFVDGHLQTTFGNVTNNFISNQSSASLDEIINTPLDEIMSAPDSSQELNFDDGNDLLRSYNQLNIGSNIGSERNRKSFNRK